MDNFTKENEGFEKYIKKSLQSIEPEPDPGMWVNIEAQQAPRNKRLRWKRTAKFGVPIAAVVIALVSALVWWKPIGQDRATGANAPIVATQSSSDASAGSDQTATPANNALIQTMKPGELPAWIPRNSVPLKSVQFLVSNGIEYRDPISGNEVSISANVLVHADGRPARGLVDLYFREYRSMADFFASDLPMHYTDPRGTFVFNSGGMFEVRVGQAGEELFLAPGQGYEVQFSPTAPLTTPNLYAFDDDTQKWGFVPSDAFGGRIETGSNGVMLPAITSDQQLFADNTRALQDATECIPDMIAHGTKDRPGQWVMDAIRVGRQLAASNKPLPKWMSRKSKKTDSSTNIIPELDAKIEIVMNKDNHTRFFPQDVSNTVTELSAFKDFYFIRTGDSLQMQEAITNVEAMLRNKPMWEQIDITQRDGAECLILLKDGDDAIQIHARLAKANGSSLQTNFDPTKIYANYKRLQQERLGKLAKEVQAMRKFLLLAPMFATGEEWCMERAEWVAYFEQNRALMLDRYNALSELGLESDEAMGEKRFKEWNDKVFKMQLNAVTPLVARHSAATNLTTTLKIMSFGIFNCDQIFRLSQKAEYVLSTYQTPEGKVIRPAELRILDRENLLFIPLQSTNYMMKLPGRYVDMVLTDRQGRIYYLSSKQHAQLDLSKEQQFTFIMEDVTDKAKTPLEWAALLQI